MNRTDAILQRLDRLIDGIAAQQAMPDDSWRAEYAAIRAGLIEPPAPAERERIAEELAEKLSSIVDWDDVGAAMTFTEAAYTHIRAALDAAAQGGE